jgi:CubicO group peptidase (beta-lactamase class C family)
MATVCLFAAEPSRAASPATKAVAASNAEVRALLAQRVTAVTGGEDGAGIVVGVIGPAGRRVIAYGRRDRGDRRPLDGDTVFEIASVGKVFTGLLLADMVRHGEVALNDPVARYLRAPVPEGKTRLITLVDLATHTSGLPFMPALPVAFESPNAPSVSTKRLYAALAGTRLEYEPGADWNYSNLDYWLLGEALAAREETDFEPLMRARVIGPLGLASTGFDAPGRPPRNLEPRLAVGHDASLRRAPLMNAVSVYNVMPASGTMVSSANDLLRLLAAQMGYAASPLNASLAAMLTTRRAMGDDQQAIGWTVVGQGDDALVMHEGGSFGFASCIAFDPKARIGDVVLTNQTTPVCDLARRLLRPTAPLATPTFVRQIEIAVDRKTLQTFAGRYTSPDVGEFVITDRGGVLTLQTPWGLPVFRLRPQSADTFFVSEMPMRATFHSDASGHVDSVTVYPPRGQRGVTAARMVPSD